FNEHFLAATLFIRCVHYTRFGLNLQSVVNSISGNKKRGNDGIKDSYFRMSPARRDFASVRSLIFLI
ncbi:MAG: hypothetical protein ACLVC2_14415, partial [Emergencia timonensis]